MYTPPTLGAPQPTPNDKTPVNSHQLLMLQKRPPPTFPVQTPVIGLVAVRDPAQIILA